MKKGEVVKKKYAKGRKGWESMRGKGVEEKKRDANKG